MEAFALSRALKAVRTHKPLVHCITNYVTVNDCANALLSCSGSPIMSDDPLDVEDITSICGGLVLNIGTLNSQTIEGMRIAGAKATELSHPIVLDPVGAGASKFRTNTASTILNDNSITVVRGNMSEVKALAGASAKTRGVDVNPADATTDETLVECIAFAKEFARKAGCVVAITGAIDIVASTDRAFAIRNGSSIMGSITGAGCMLSAVCGAYAVAAKAADIDVLEAVIACVSQFGVAGEMANARMGKLDGNGTFRTYLLDALYNMDDSTLEAHAHVEEL